MSVWLTVDDDGTEKISDRKPVRFLDDCWIVWTISLPKGTLKKLIGRELTWDDDPVEYKGD